MTQSRFQQRPSLRKSRGVTLIEVLVAVLVLSIGLIGLAALQANALQANHSSYMRSQATNLAYDIADRMRTNRQAALSGDYDTAFTDNEGTGGACNPNLSLTGDLADQDLAQWKNAIACTLPAGQASVFRNGDTFTITVRWQEDRIDDDDDDDAPADGYTEVFTTRTEI
ncbi:type IV pilus modification protein PilV [Thioalkalivibrio sp. ALE11]|uniref:type IV pilus modification protein PilV n=1 Tax=Thioalkalivibrio sp. ALE11 TaxID=1265494 RepID=UPI0004764E9F|nr:type IV pilus modification protein PilV [Thioalkalivibrio sp. ALE11]